METNELLQEVLVMFRDREASHQREVEEFRKVFAEQRNHHEEEVSELHRLLMSSEERIDSTSTMVQSLVSTLESIKDAYVHHLDKAVDSRDEIIAQNKLLLERISSAETVLKEERSRYDRLMRDLVEMSVGHGMAVNIKQ